MFGVTFKGLMLSMASAEIRIAESRMVALTSITPKDGVTAEPEYGSGPIALGTALGQHKAELTFDQHLTEATKLTALLSERGNGSFALAQENFSVIFTTTGQQRQSGLATPIESFLIKNVRFLGFEPKLTNDGKSTIVTWSTVVTEPIEWTIGGKTVYSLDPTLFAPSNSIAVGLGGGIEIG